MLKNKYDTWPVLGHQFLHYWDFLWKSLADNKYVNTDLECSRSVALCLSLGHGMAWQTICQAPVN